MNATEIPATPLEPEIERRLTLDFRRRVIGADASFGDAVVLFGLVASGRVNPDAVREWLADGQPLARAVSRGLNAGVIPTDQWTLFQQLWYRWQIPFGVASLTWWYLFCVALKRVTDVPEACDLLANWLERLEDAQVDRRVEMHAALTGLHPYDRAIVAIKDDISALPCFVAAALHGVPLISVGSEGELRLIEKAGARVVFSDVEPWKGDVAEWLQSLDLPKGTRDVANLQALCLGREVRLDKLSDVRTFWSDFPPEERTFVLIHLEHKIAALEIVRFGYGNVVFGNEQLVETIAACRRKRPDAWTSFELAVATILWAWQEGGFMVHELNHSEVSLHSLRVFLERRVAEYERITGSRIPVGVPLPELVQRFAGLRKAVERTHQRCIYFDGGNFERREFLLRKADLVPHRELPEKLKVFMLERFGVPMPEGDPIAAWKAYLGELADRGRTPSDLMIALADWASNAEDLPVDIAVFDVPKGVKLDKPWDLQYEDVFCYTGFRTGWEPQKVNLPLNFVGVRNAIGQRMRYNAVKKAQNYALIKRTTPQSFLLPDVSVGEDANHAGHDASGIRHACRVPMVIHFDGSDWRGIADVRLSRTDYSDANRFREKDLAVATRYGVWAKAIADETYARKLLFDAHYCVNLDDGRDVFARLGREPKRGRA